MPRVGTIRTAVAALLLAAATVASDSSGAGAIADAEAATTRAPRPVTIAWGGDVTLGSSYGNPPGGGRPLLAPVARRLRRADVAAVNYEGTFGPGGASKCASGRPNCFAFQAPPGNARALRGAGVDIVNHANNHAFDYGALGWRSTRDALAAAKVDATGAPGEILTLKRNGTRIAFAGFSTYGWTNSMADDVKVRALIARAAAQADIVVAFLHAGAEGASKAKLPRGPEEAFGEYRGNSRHFAHTAIDAGADLVLGSGPHVLRGLELYRRRLIAYSLGNLAGWHNFNTSGNSGLSAVLTVALDPEGRYFVGQIDSLTLDRAGAPHRDPSGRAAAFIRARTRTDFTRSPLRIDGRGRVMVAR